MPLLEAPLEDLNQKLGAKGVLSPNEIAAIQGATSFLQLFQALGLAPATALVTYMAAWPASLQHGVVAAIGEAVAAEPRIPVSAIYNPGYDFRVEMEESAGSVQSQARLSIVVIGPYPSHVQLVRPWVAAGS